MSNYIEFGLVSCPAHGYQMITEAQYDEAMNNPDDHWRCPICALCGEWIDQDDMEHSADYSDQPF